jgi:hypothetical protein
MLIQHSYPNCSNLLSFGGNSQFIGRLDIITSVIPSMNSTQKLLMEISIAKMLPQRNNKLQSIYVFTYPVFSTEKTSIESIDGPMVIRAPAIGDCVVNASCRCGWFFGHGSTNIDLGKKTGKAAEAIPGQTTASTK